jgi:predicted permease
MPPFLNSVAARLRALFRRDAVAGEIHDELQFHLQMRIEEYERRGHSAADARRLATARVGNIAVHQDRGYDVRGGGVLETVVQDVRYAFRLWRHQPGFAVVAVGTIALGISASTMLFSVIDAAVLRPLPFAHPEQLAIVFVNERGPDGSEIMTGPSLNDARSWRAASQSISAAGAMRTYPEPVVVELGGSAERAAVSEMGDDCLEVYQQSVAMGRGFSAADLAPGAPRVVMLGYGYWQQRFAGSAAVLGQTVRFVEGGASTIIGVLPAGFYRKSDIWRPHLDTDAANAERRGTGTSTYARLRPGVTMAAAGEELTRLTRQREAEQGHVSNDRIILQPLLADARSGHGATISLLIWTVALVLVIACVNVAGLLLARGTARQSEFAIRASIGAGRGRLVRQLLTESALLAVIGGLSGCLLAWLSLDTLVSLVPLELPASSSATLNPAVLAFAMALSIATSLAFGLLPALKLSRGDTMLDAAGSRQRHGSSLSRRSGQWLIGVEVAVSIVLLVAAGLFVRSLNRLMTTDIGFDPQSVLMMSVAPISQSHGELGQYYPALLERVRARPDVASVGAVDIPPLGELGIFGFARSRYRDHWVDVRIAQALPGYVEAMGFVVREGRIPAASEFDSGRLVVINEAAARQLFPQGSAVGQSIELGLKDRREIAAVIENVRQDGPARQSEPMVISLASRHINGPLTVVIRSKVDSRIAVADLRNMAQSIGPAVFIDHVGPATDLLAETTATPRHRTLLFSLLGGLGLVLTLVGIFGTTAYAVATRTREIGVRMAFGARPGQVVWTIVSDAAWPVVVGSAAGVGGALLSTNLIAKFLFETTPTDALTFASVVLMLGAAAVVAAWLPARRAARVDPVAALRSE